MAKLCSSDENVTTYINRNYGKICRDVAEIVIIAGQVLSWLFSDSAHAKCATANKYDIRCDLPCKAVLFLHSTYFQFGNATLQQLEMSSVC